MVLQNKTDHKFAKIRVLLVEDSCLTSMVTKFLLQSYGCNVITADNGLNALEIYRRFSCAIDLIITDIEMPIMDGHALLKALQNEFQKDLCFVCAFSTLVNAKNVSRFRFDDFISKPAYKKELHTLVEKIKHLKIKLI